MAHGKSGDTREACDWSTRAAELKPQQHHQPQETAHLRENVRTYECRSAYEQGKSPVFYGGIHGAESKNDHKQTITVRVPM
jgi:hypothetical protein